MSKPSTLKKATSSTDKRHAFVQPIPDLAHRLFYQARNLAIEAMLLRITDRLLRQGFNARCEWSESSFGAPNVYVRMYNLKPQPGRWEYGTCTLTLNRERILAPEHASHCFYSLKDVITTEYWGAKQPKQLLEFRSTVQALADEGYFAEEIAKVNYPFDSERYSVY